MLIPMGFPCTVFFSLFFRVYSLGWLVLFCFILFLIQADCVTSLFQIFFTYTRKQMDSGCCVFVYIIWDFFLLGSPVTISIQMTIS